MKAVFDTKPNSGYDDEIVRRYHFPTLSNYVAAAQSAVGDWIVYREPQRNGGRRAYIAVARVVAIEIGAPFDHGLDQVRRVEQMLVNRKIRDANFRRHVCEAYDDRCAVTGLRIINGGGRSDVQAAHIWSVGDGGPDVSQNGLALSGTVHWLFDRHLIALTDDYRLLVSHDKAPPDLRVLFERQMDRIHLPKDERLWPHKTYVEMHRERFIAA